VEPLKLCLEGEIDVFSCVWVNEYVRSQPLFDFDYVLKQLSVKHNCIVFLDAKYAN